MPNYFTEFKNGPSGPSYKVKDEEAQNRIANKVDKVEGKGLSTNDYDNVEKGKVADNASAIEAMVNVNGCCNVFDLDNPIEINGFSKTGTTLTNTHTDAKDFFEFMLWSWVGNTPSTLIFGTNITSNGHKVFDVTIPSNYDKLQFRHNGASRDLWVIVSNVPAGDYKISFDVTGHNPSVVGGLEISNIMLYDVRLNPTGYVPYAMTNRELTERIIQQDIPINVEIPAHGYNFVDVTPPTGYRPFAVNTLFNSLALFAQPNHFENQSRISLFNALDVTATFDSTIRVWFIKS